MTGLVALLDDVAAIAKLAAAQLDDIAAQAGKAGAKAAGAAIDDTAVTPKYVAGLPAARELPIIWKIARASVFNKLVILLPAALLLDATIPWLLTPLLMLGGAYLSFEGAEKIWHLIQPEPQETEHRPQSLDAAHLEKARVAGAIKTDFILSAEIMTIALSQIQTDSIWTRGLALAAVAIAITAAVYGAVALLVKLDDIGLRLSQIARLSALRAFGRGMVRAMPKIMLLLSTVGTAAMLWVGGNIIVHGLQNLGWPLPYDTIHHLAAGVEGTSAGAATLRWLITATLDGIVGLALGLLLLPLVTLGLAPILRSFMKKSSS